MTPEEEEALLAMAVSGQRDPGTADAISGAQLEALAAELAGDGDLPDYGPGSMTLPGRPGGPDPSTRMNLPGRPGGPDPSTRMNMERGHSRVAVGGDPVTDPRALPGDLVRDAPGPSPQLSGMDPRAALPTPRAPQRTGKDKLMLALNALASGATGKEDALGFNEVQAQRAAAEKQRMAQGTAAAKRSDLQRRIGERVAAQTGFDPNMTVEEYQRAIQGGAGKRALEGQKGGIAQDRLDDEQAWKSGEGQKDRESREGIAAGRDATRRATARQRRRGGSGGGAGLSAEENNVLEKYENADTLTSEESALLRGVWRKVGTSGRQVSSKMHGEAERRHTEQRKDLRKRSSNQAGIKHAMRAYHEFVDGMDDGARDAAFADASSPVPSTADGRALRDKVRMAVAKYVSTLGGKALTDSEKSIYSGPLGSWLEPTALEELRGGSGSLIEAGRKAYLGTRVDEDTVERLLEDLENETNASFKATLQGPERATALWNSGDAEAALDMVEDHLRSIGETRELQEIGPVGNTAAKWSVTFEDGESIEFRMP